VLKRYVIAGIIIILVSLATAGIAYAAASTLTYNASCTVGVFVRAPLTSAPAPGPDFLTFTNNLAANEVSSATPKAYQQLAQSEHLSFGAIFSKVQLQPAIGIGAFRVSVTDPNPNLTKRISRSACTTFVNVITKQRADEINADLKVIQKRITTIQADVQRLAKIPAKRRTAAEALSLATQQEALNTNSLLIVQYNSLVPDHISVLTPATAVAAQRSVSLKKYLLIAAVAALLAIFLYILVVEALSTQRTGNAGESS
jgi:hypothetical protein